MEGKLTVANADGTLPSEGTADLKAKGKAKLVRVGRIKKTVAAGAKADLSVAINAKAKAALKRLGKLKLTLRVTIAGKTTTSTVTLRKPTKATAPGVIFTAGVAGASRAARR